jgi:hypothetical protein
MSQAAIVDKQLEHYNRGEFEPFAACYHPEIVSYDLETSKPNPQMSGAAFFAHYKKKFAENPKLHCQVVQRVLHDHLVVDKEKISDCRSQDHTEMVIYQIDNGLITKMWFSRELPIKK